jgi:hypothetical protein
MSFSFSEKIHYEARGTAYPRPLPKGKGESEIANKNEN